MGVTEELLLGTARLLDLQHNSREDVQGGFFTGPSPLKVLSTKKLIWARLGVSGTSYVNVDSPNLGFTYSNFLGGYQ